MATRAPRPRRRLWQLGFQTLALAFAAGAVAAASAPCGDGMTLTMALCVAGSAAATTAAIAIPWVYNELGERIARRRRKRIAFAITVSLLTGVGLAFVVVFLASMVQAAHCPVESPLIG